MAKVIQLPKRKQDTGKNHQQVIKILKTLPKDITLPEIYKNPENKPEIELLKKLMQEDLKSIQKFTESLQELIIEVVDKKNRKAEQLLKKLGNRLIKNISKRLANNTTSFKTIPTYNGLGNTMTKPQYEVIADLIRKNKSENDRRTLQEILVKHVMEDKDFTVEQKKELLQFIKDNKSNKVIENCLMLPLTRDEKRILRTLMEEIYEQVQTGQIATSGITVYEVCISYDKFFSLYGVSNDSKTTKHIKDILFGRKSHGLRKNIIIENNNVAIATSLILQIDERKEKINLHKKDVGTGFIITMPSFLFVGEEKQNAKDYYNQENEGHRRFMQSGNIAQSDAASNIACKLEILCHSTLHNKKIKNKAVELNLKTLINIAGYEKRYKKSPTEVKIRINDILDTLTKERYLIESWYLTKGKYKQDQYIIKPLKIN